MNTKTKTGFVIHDMFNQHNRYFVIADNGYEAIKHLEALKHSGAFQAYRYRSMCFSDADAFIEDKRASGVFDLWTVLEAVSQ